MEVTVFYANSIYCICPNPECGERVEHWHADPSGDKTTCDYCEVEFNIGKNIDIEIDL